MPSSGHRRNYRVEADKYRQAKAEQRAVAKLRAEDQKKLATLQEMCDRGGDPGCLRDRTLFEHKMSRAPEDRMPIRLLHDIDEDLTPAEVGLTTPRSDDATEGPRTRRVFVHP